MTKLHFPPDNTPEFWRAARQHLMNFKIQIDRLWPDPSPRIGIAGYAQGEPTCAAKLAKLTSFYVTFPSDLHFGPIGTIDYVLPAGTYHRPENWDLPGFGDLCAPGNPLVASARYVGNEEVGEPAVLAWRLTWQVSGTLVLSIAIGSAGAAYGVGHCGDCALDEDVEVARTSQANGTFPASIIIRPSSDAPP